MTEELTEADLRAAARRRGFTVTATQLKAWRRGGLVPRPRQAHQHGRTGSSSLYPHGTLARLIRTCELRRLHSSLDRIRFELWWEGAQLEDVGPVRTYLLNQFGSIFRGARELRDGHDDPFDAAEAAVAEGPAGIRDPRLRAMRRQAGGPEEFASAVVNVLLELFGGDAPWDLADPASGEATLRATVNRMAGVERAQRDPVFNAKPLLSSDADPLQFIRAAITVGLIDLDHPGRLIRDASDQELEAARDQGSAFERFKDFTDIVQAEYGRDYAGLSIMRAALNGSVVSRASLIQLFLAFPMMSTPEEQRHKESTLQALRDNRLELHCHAEFDRELPGYAFLTKPDGLERLNTLPAEEREVIRTVVNHFLARHPECNELLTQEGTMPET